MMPVKVARPIQPQKWLSAALILLLALLLTACASPPKKPELGISIEAAADVNPDLQGRPSPVILHVMELKSVEQFNSLDYMGLANAANGALGSDLVNRSQMILSPGSSKSMSMELDPVTSHIGLVAGYRDIDNATWRVTVPIDQENPRPIAIRLSQSQLSASAQ